MKKEDALRKIKACWARANCTGSSEEEAAAALRQAMALMREFELDEIDVKAADVNELEARSGGADKPPEWEAVLSAACGWAFGCKVLHTQRWDRPNVWTFIGIEPATTQAQYAFTVLFRRAVAARAEYIKAKLKRCKPANKTARGNLFAEGWVTKVVSPVYRMPKQTRHHEAIEAYLQKEKPNLASLKTRSGNAKALDKGDRHAGIKAGDGVEWTRGLGGANEPRRIGHDG